MHIFGKITRVLLVTLLTAGCAGAPVKPESLAPGDYRYVRDYITWLARKEMNRNKVTGLSIALVDDQRVVWAEGFGYADKARDIKASPDTIYRVGSISKLFTDTAAMQLAEQGKLDIDKPLQTYLPEFSVRTRFSAPREITPRSLMTHHSGLPSDYLKGMWTKHPEPFTGLVAKIRDEYAAQPPGTVFSYSNLGISLLGVAMERVSGNDFTTLVEKSLLQPLGMSHSRFAPGPDTSPLAAKAYRDGDEVEETPLRDMPAGGLNSSVNDLARFMAMVFAGGVTAEQRIVKQETLAGMLSTQNGSVPLDLNFRTGLGWVLSAFGGMDIKNAGTVAHHSGATLYHRGMLAILPEQKLGVVVLANSPGGSQVVSTLAAEALKLALEAKTGIKQPEPATTAAGAATDEKLNRYEGTYATMAGVVRLTNKSGYLATELMGYPLRLVPRSDGRFALRFTLFGIFPISLGELDRAGIRVENIAGTDALIADLDGQELLAGKKIVSAELPDAWKKRSGEYRITNPGDDVPMFDNVRLRCDRDLLLMDIELPLLFKGRLSFALQPVSGNEAVIEGFGRGMGETIRATSRDGKEFLFYSGYVLEKQNAE